MSDLLLRVTWRGRRVLVVVTVAPEDERRLWAMAGEYFPSAHLEPMGEWADEYPEEDCT